MTVNAFDVQEGMEVYSSDGEKLGKISHIFSAASSVASGGGITTAAADRVDSSLTPQGTLSPAQQDLEVEQLPTTDVPGPTGGPPSTTWSPGGSSQGMPSATMTDAATMSQTDRYFQVDQGGVLGIGAKHLYIPFGAVSDVAPGECVTVSCTKDQCGDMYGEKPASLEETHPGLT